MALLSRYEWHWCAGGLTWAAVWVYRGAGALLPLGGTGGLMRVRTTLTMVIALMLVAAIPAVAVASDRRDGPVHLLPANAGNAVLGATVVVNATADQAHITLRTSGLIGGNAYTLWSISFSYPQECSHGNAGLGLLCGPGDDGPGPQGFAIQQAAGHIVGNSGRANFGGSVPVANAAGAEYHIVVADHGPKVPADMPLQIKSPGPGVQIGFILP